MNRTTLITIALFVYLWAVDLGVMAHNLVVWGLLFAIWLVEHIRYWMTNRKKNKLLLILDVIVCVVLLLVTLKLAAE